MILFGFVSYQDGSFELIVKDDKTFEETTLHGKLKPDQLEQINRILPTCVFVEGKPINHFFLMKSQYSPSKAIVENMLVAGPFLDFLSAERVGREKISNRASPNYSYSIIEFREEPK